LEKAQQGEPWGPTVQKKKMKKKAGKPMKKGARYLYLILAGTET